MGTAIPKTKAKAAARAEGMAPRVADAGPTADASLAYERGRSSQRLYGNAEVARVAGLPGSESTDLAQAGIVGRGAGFAGKPNPYGDEPSTEKPREGKPNPYGKGGQGTPPPPKPKPNPYGGGDGGGTSPSKPNPYGKAGSQGAPLKPKANPYGKTDDKAAPSRSKPNPYGNGGGAGAGTQSKPNPYGKSDEGGTPSQSKPNPYETPDDKRTLDKSKPNPYGKPDDKPPTLDRSKPNPYLKDDAVKEPGKSKPNPYGDAKEKAEKSKPNPYEKGDGKGTIEKSKDEKRDGKGPAESKPNPYEKGEGKSKGGKKGQKKGKEEGAARGGAEEGADSEEAGGEGGKQEGGREAEETGGEGEGPGREGGGEEVAAEVLPPPERPRLEGTEAVKLSMPPLGPQQLERIRTQTGLTAAEHYARVQVHLDRLSDYARAEQFAIVVHIELVESEVRRDLENAAALIQPAVRSSIDTVRGAVAGARAAINGASKDAVGEIEKNATAADRKVDSTAVSSKEAVEKAVLATSPKLHALHEETMAPLRELLAKNAEAYRAAGLLHAEALVEEGGAIKGRLAKRGGDPIQQAQLEKMGEAAVQQAKEGTTDLVQAGEAGATAILGLETTFSLSYLKLVNPVAVKTVQVGQAGAKEATDKGGEVRLRLATDHERALGFVETTQKRALAALDALERSAVQQLELMGRRLEEMARARREQLCHSLLEGRGPAAEAWAQQMAQVNELVPPGQIVDARRLEPPLVAALASMHALSSKQRLDFDAQARSRFDETRAGLDEDRAALDQTAESFVGAARDTRRQAAGIREAGATFVSGFRRVSQPASTKIIDFRRETEEKLGLSVDDTRKQMKQLLANSTESMDKGLEGFYENLGAVVKGLEARLAPTFKQVEPQVIEDLADRAGRAFRAMDKPGTDENGLFDALRGMTPVYGQALAYYWMYRGDGHIHDLWWWLKDELSGDEYWTAYHHLRGEGEIAVQFELKTYIHWYGDEVGQMEKALRALTPEQLKKLNADKDFADVRKELTSNLKGTNLEVVDALIAGRTARADALRLKQQIDAARARGDDDKVHELLSAVDPKRLPEIHREFVDIKAGNKMVLDEETKLGVQLPVDEDKEKQKEKDKANAKEFTTYITRPVKVWEPTGVGGTVRERTREITGASKKLAEVLATEGEGSTEARAARLVYETSRGGKPRPEKLAKALDDPELVAARRAANDPKLKAPDADPKQVAAVKDRLDELEKRRKEVFTKFTAARASGLDPYAMAVAHDPKLRQKYTEDTVANLFGDDKLGRDLGSSMVSDGRAKPAVAIKYAVRGWGTNEELIRKTLRGMSKAEIAELKADYAERFGKSSDGKRNENKLFDDLGVFQNAKTADAAGVSHATGGGFFTELSGDDRHEVERLLLGKPENDRDRWRLAQLDYQHQRGEGTTWATSLFQPTAVGPAGITSGSISERGLEMNKAHMDEMLAAAGGEKEAFDKDGNFKGVPGRFSQNDFRLRVAATSEMAENYKHHIDSLADMITSAIMIIGAVVGTIVVTVLTLGTATPLVIGLWAAGIAAATGAAAMATNYALKGSRYGWEQAAVDGALTLLDAATAGLTAGAGVKAARVAAKIAAIKSAARTTSQVSKVASIAKAVDRKELARGFVRAAKSAGVGGAARTATADGTWDDGFMTGLGRTVSGGVKAAAVGVATHGASTGFSRSRLGERLGKSTNYLTRGTGSGLGGAVGGFAGRGTELTLDALGGHQQGDMGDALLSLVASGGRGFAENFGQGMAEVRKARRDARQQEQDDKSRRSDNERVARTGMTQADVEGDLRFRRMAVAAAKEADPRLDAKAFLRDLDASVAQDRARVETNRQLIRTFRKEALAAIPPARRGEFADVPIHLVTDEEFERFTGSRSGRAVTVIVDGEAQIVVRRKAAPEVMREEGIHVLQSRDPQWRERIKRLDERTLSRWDELDLETQLSLYRDKLEIELDGQERLRTDLAAEARKTRDPARKAALEARIDEADATHQALRARRDEVDSIGPAQRAAIQRGDQKRPQYLREPPRLFGKPKPAELKPQEGPVGPELKHNSDLKDVPRHPVDLKNSTWDKEYAGHRIYQVGNAWHEHETYLKNGEVRTRKRWYRMVEVTKVVDGVEVVVDRRREILGLGRKGRWRQRGSESSVFGTLFEEASRQHTLARIRRTLGREIKLTDPEIPIGALRPLGSSLDDVRRTRAGGLTAQTKSGAGFDDVVLRFSMGEDGVEVAHIVIIEAKGHRRALTLEDFTAIAHNLPQNLAELERIVLNSDLPASRKLAVSAAIERNRIEFELHRSPTAKIGAIDSRQAKVLKDIVRTHVARQKLSAAIDRILDLDASTLTPAGRLQAQKDLRRLSELAQSLKRAYTAEPFRPARVRKILAEILGGYDKPGTGAVARIAARHSLAIDVPTPPLRHKLKLDPRASADQPYFERARAEVKGARGDVGYEVDYAVASAQKLGVLGEGFKPVRPVSVVHPDVIVAHNEATKGVVAIARPGKAAPDAGSDSAVSRQLVALLRDPISLPGGTTARPDHVLWDTSGAKPAEIVRVLEQVRVALGPRAHDAARLRVMVDGALASDEVSFRRALALPDVVSLSRHIRQQGNIIWMLILDDHWVEGPRKEVDPRPSARPPRPPA